MTCPDCGYYISRKAKKCPYCGARIKKKINTARLVIIIILLIIIGLVGAFAQGYDPIKPVLDGIQEINYRLQPDTRPTPEPTPEPTPDPTVQAQEIIPYFELRYFANSISSEQLGRFCEMYTAIKNFEDVCTFTIPATEDDVSALLVLISYECPELMNFSSSGRFTTTLNEAGEITSITLKYSMSKEDYSKRYVACATEVKRIAAEAEGMTAEEKEAYAYSVLTSSIVYKAGLADSGNAYGALINNKAKCDGISMAMKWVCEEMGIPCIFVTGKEGTADAGHAWNMVELDGKWYNIDLTNDCRSTASEETSYLYGAYNVSASVLTDLYPLTEELTECFELPADVGMEKSWHVLNGSYIRRGRDYSAVLNAQLDALAAEGEVGETVSVWLQFQTLDDYTNCIDTISATLNDWVNENTITFLASMEMLQEFRTIRIDVTWSSFEFHERGADVYVYDADGLVQ